jgi:DNA invertase Pin-like site-specific DNA recombinase
LAIGPTRTQHDLIQIVNNLNERGIGFQSLQENLTMDRSNATGQLMFHLFAAFAERNLIQERSAAGREAAKTTTRQKPFSFTKGAYRSER